MPPLPTPHQLAWQRAGFGLFHHFGINTFFGKEWSDGSLPAAGFAPQALDCAQWVETAKSAGARYAILTAKHHDGFCLWPTATTGYSVASSPWKDGRGDVVGEFVAACRAADLPCGLYCSPWDRNHPAYGDKAAYDAVYARQLEELCTRYGELFEVWFDGAGSEGRSYDWDRIMAIVERHQPQAMVFNMGRPTIRWVGNEDGLAAEPVDYVVHATKGSAFTHEESRLLERDGRWLPPECDVAIRQNWFWQDDDLATLKRVDQLLAIAYRSIGLGANLLLNVPPDRRGLIDDQDRERLLAFAAAWRQRQAGATEAALTRDGNAVIADLGAPTPCDHLWLEEVLDQGQVVDRFAVSDADSGEPIATGRTIGSQRVVVFPRCEPRRLRIDLPPGARLARVAAVLVGREDIPDPAPELDYGAWAEKADKPAAAH